MFISEDGAWMDVQVQEDEFARRSRWHWQNDYRLAPEEEQS